MSVQPGGRTNRFHALHCPIPMGNVKAMSPTARATTDSALRPPVRQCPSDRPRARDRELLVPYSYLIANKKAMFAK